jgi:multiple sugar transport system substrate-binding protein
MASNGTISPSVTCGLQDCVTVCPSNVTELFTTLEGAACGGGGYGTRGDISEETPVVTLKFLTATWGAWIVPVAERFSRDRPDVNIEIVQVALSELSPNIINEATSKTGLFDGFVTPPAVMGSIVEEDGWADLTGYIDSTPAQAKDWSDIFLNYRKWISQYQEKILMFPLDGDVLNMFYRKDVMEEFGLQVPRTWEEYNIVAAATHGKEFKNRTLTGSCIGRMLGCAGPYWANLVLSSMTQQRGTSEGHLFDTSDMSPLLDEAFVKTLELLEYQAMYGRNDEFEGCVEINGSGMTSGTCVLSYNWGTFKIAGTEGSIFRDGDGEMGVAETPGSTHVLDRVTKKLVPCNKDICPFGAYYDDIGWVNRAPYLAFGGW